MSTADHALLALQPRAYYARFASRGVRPDGRATTDFRKTTLALGTVGTADGSCTLRAGGGTAVVAAVTAEVVPLSGAATAAAIASDGLAQAQWAGAHLAVEVALPALASPRFRARGGGPAVAMELRRGPALAREIERLVISNGLLDERQLVLEAGVAGWRLTVDVVATAADGNVEDAAVMAALAALAATRLPPAVKRHEGGWARADAVAPASSSSSSSSSTAASRPAATADAAPLRVASLLVPATVALIELGGQPGAGGGDDDEGQQASAAAAAVLVADPTAGEEDLACGSTRTVLAVPLAAAAAGSAKDDVGADLPVAGLLVDGGGAAGGWSRDRLAACAALAQRRAAALAGVLRTALAGAGVATGR